VHLRLYFPCVSARRKRKRANGVTSGWGHIRNKELSGIPGRSMSKPLSRRSRDLFLRESQTSIRRHREALVGIAHRSGSRRSHVPAFIGVYQRSSAVDEELLVENLCVPASPREGKGSGFPIMSGLTCTGAVFAWFAYFAVEMSSRGRLEGVS
jgi:hypothetical protein